MEHNRIGRRGSFLRPGLAAFLSAGGAVGLWMALAQGGMTVWLAVALLTVAIPFGTIWQSRARAARRLQDVWDAYARQEMARVEHRKATAP